MRASEGRHLAFFDGMRGVAAFAVVLFHISIHDRMQDLMAVLPEPVVQWGFRYGALGVAVFFVLSGFVIGYSLDRWRGTAQADSRGPVKPAGVFLTKRLVRLTPPYYAAIAFALVMAVGAAVVNNEPYEPGLAPFSVGRLVAHLFYVQEILGYLNFNDVFWTLAVELQFYIALVVVWLVKEQADRRSGPRAGAWVVVASAVIGLLWPFNVIEVDGRSPWFMNLWYSFALGVMLYLTWRRLLPKWMAPAYIAVLALAAAVRDAEPQFLVATAGTGAIIVVAMELGRLDRWLTMPPFGFLGRISYSLYLIHAPILGAVLLVMTRIGPDTLWWDLVALTVAVAVSLGLSTVFYYLFELPSIRYSKRVQPRSPTPQPVEAGS